LELAGDKERRGFFFSSLELKLLASLLDSLMLALVCSFILKKSSSIASEETTIELLFVALVEVGLLDSCGVASPGPFPNIVLLRLSLDCLPESYLLV
jgi:hypothetical protein